MMKQPKNIKKLLQLCLKHIDLIDDLGLCHLSDMLWERRIITRYQNEILEGYIMKNTPLKNKYWMFLGGKIIKTKARIYIWKPGSKAPRINWLKNHIKKAEL